MNGRHWSEDDFVNALYGVGPEDEHLGECADCRGRWTQMTAQRAEAMRQPEVSHEFLAAQRRNIYRRLDRRRPGRVARLTPAFAAFAALLIGFYFFRPSPAPAPAPLQMSDAQLAEIISVEQASEARAAKPIEALFESN